MSRFPNSPPARAGSAVRARIGLVFAAETDHREGHAQPTLRRRTPLAIPSLAAILALSPAALAQPAKPKPGFVPAPAPGLVVPAPAPAAVAPIIAVPPPPPIELNDPMLVPVPQAGKVLTDWKQALNLILARSTNLATALQEVERAEGNARIALAGALPTITGTVNVTGQLITTAVPANPGFTYMGRQVIPATVAYTCPTPTPRSSPRSPSRSPSSPRAPGTGSGPRRWA